MLSVSPAVCAAGLEVEFKGTHALGTHRTEDQRRLEARKRGRAQRGLPYRFLRVQSPRDTLSLDLQPPGCETVGCGAIRLSHSRVALSRQPWRRDAAHVLRDPLGFTGTALGQEAGPFPWKCQLRGSTRN